MNNVPNESRIIMLSGTEISFVISFFDFEKFGVKPRFPSSFFYSNCILIQQVEYNNLNHEFKFVPHLFLALFFSTCHPPLIFSYSGIDLYTTWLGYG